MTKKKTPKKPATKALPSSTGSARLPITPRFQQVLSMAMEIAKTDGMNYADTEHLESALKGVETKLALGQRFTREELEQNAKDYLRGYYEGEACDEYFTRLGLMVSFSHFLFQNTEVCQPEGEKRS